MYKRCATKRRCGVVLEAVAEAVAGEVRVGGGFGGRARDTEDGKVEVAGDLAEIEVEAELLIGADLIVLGKSEDEADQVGFGADKAGGDVDLEPAEELLAVGDADLGGQVGIVQDLANLDVVAGHGGGDSWADAAQGAVQGVAQLIADVV